MVNYFSAGIGLGVLMAIGGASAATAASAQEPKPVVAQKNVSDKELQNFAKAYVAYHKIRQSYESRLSTVQDPKEREKIQREGDAKVSQALQKQGLTPDSYNRVFAAVNNNEQLRKRALKLIDEERKNS